jgi:hypothetical protein
MNNTAVISKQINENLNKWDELAQLKELQLKSVLLLQQSSKFEHDDEKFFVDESQSQKIKPEIADNKAANAAQADQTPKVINLSTVRNI